MQTNNMLELARETRKKIRKVFTDKVETITAKFSEITYWDAYLTEIMKEIELRIPEKYLKAKGWL